MSLRTNRIKDFTKPYDIYYEYEFQIVCIPMIVEIRHVNFTYLHRGSYAYGHDKFKTAM